MNSDPELESVNCEEVTRSGIQDCKYYYHHAPSDSMAEFDVRLRNGVIDLIIASSKSEDHDHDGCASFSMSNNYRELKTDPSARDYELHALHREIGCPQTDFGITLWGFVDILKRLDFKKTIGARVTKSGAIFGKRTNSTFLPTDENVIINYNLNGIQEYAQKKLAMNPINFQKRT